MKEKTDAPLWQDNAGPPLAVSRTREPRMKALWRRIRRPLADSSLLKHVIAWLIHVFLRLTFVTNRWAEGSHRVKRDLVPLRGSIFVMWHGQHLLMPTLRPSGQPVAAMFSRSADAEINAILAQTFGIEPVRGSGGDPERRSAAKGGARALSALRNRLARQMTGFMGADSRHAPRQAMPGSLLLARISGRPVYPIAIATSRRKVLRKTWDQTTINLPFGRKCLIVGEPVHVPSTVEEGQLEELRRALTASLDAATDEAYRKVDGIG